MANNKLPFGLCEKYRIKLPDGATPKDAWEALKKNGIEYFEEEESTVLNPSDFLGDDEYSDTPRITNKSTQMLPKKEYYRVVSIVSKKIAGTKADGSVVNVRSANFRYTVEIHEFGVYRIIEKKPID